MKIGLCATLQEIKDNGKEIKELHPETIRVPLQWSLVEPTYGEFDFSLIDPLVKAAKAQGMNILFNVRAVSDWGTPSSTQIGGYHSSGMPYELGRWEDFLTNIAYRYMGYGGCVHYEIENEVSTPAFWSGSKMEYLELLKRSYSAIKSVDPTALVLCSAMPSGITKNFLGPNDKLFKAYHDDWLLSYLPSKAFDIVSVHDYYFPDHVVNGFSFRSYFQHIRKIMGECGISDKRIWITEAGYISRRTKVGTRIDDGSAKLQAERTYFALNHASSLGVDKFFWILLKDRSEPYFGSMGLLSRYNVKRPVWGVLKERM